MNGFPPDGYYFNDIIVIFRFDRKYCVQQICTFIKKSANVAKLLPIVHFLASLSNFIYQQHNETSEYLEIVFKFKHLNTMKSVNRHRI